MFTKFVNKNAIKPEKGVPSAKKFNDPYTPSRLGVTSLFHLTLVPTYALSLFGDIVNLVILFPFILFPFFLNKFWRNDQEIKFQEIESHIFQEVERTSRRSKVSF